MFSFNFTIITLDTNKYRRQMAQVLLEELKQGGHIWLDAALAIIPVWSGASHGTFVKFAEKIGMSINMSMSSSNAFGLGPSAGTGASSATLETSHDRFILEYKTSLWHLIYNEAHNANMNPEAGGLFAQLKKPGPYNFQGIGGAAFAAFANHVRLPSVRNAFKLTRYKV